MNPADVALVRFPFSSLESEPFKLRPVLVAGAVGQPPDQAILVIMITSNARRFQRPGPGDIVIRQWEACGLQKPSVLSTRRVWTAENRDFTRTLGRVDEVLLEEARIALRALIG